MTRKQSKCKENWQPIKCQTRKLLKNKSKKKQREMITINRCKKMTITISRVTATEKLRRLKLK